MSDLRKGRAIFAIFAIFILIFVSIGICGILNPQKKNHSFTPTEVEQIRRCFSELEGKE